MTVKENKPEVSKNEVPESENLWSSILSDVQKRGNQKLPSCKQILVLGDNETGKTTMVAKLQGLKDPKKGWGLEYAYIDVRDDYRDDNTRLSVWVLDGDAGHTGLLKFSLNEETFAHNLVILTVTMTAPWGILDQLRHWASVLADHVDKLKLDIDQRQANRQRLVKHWQDYVEPGDELDPASPMKRSSRNLGDALLDGDMNENSPLPEGTLTNNLGLDIVVVVTKTDYIQNLEKEQDYRDEHLDFIQQHIRKFCLQYGAALFYTSAKEDKNCDLLYKYLTHRIYGFQFRTPALVVEKDAVFIPAGWDNMKKISILYESLHTCRADDYYTDIIAPPTTRRNMNLDVEVVAEDEQLFLGRMQQILLATDSSSPLSSCSTDSPLKRTSLGKGTPRSPAGMHGSAKKLDGSKVVGSPGGEGVLANFFNSLLHKKTGASPASSVNTPPNPKVAASNTPDSATMRSDAAAELDRLSRGRTSSPDAVDFNASDC